MIRPCFIHIPKAAGTSMQKFLFERYGRHNVYVENLWEKAEHDILGLNGPEMRPENFLAFGGHTPFEFYQTVPDIFCFAFVREPLARRQSEYAYIRRTPDHEVHRIVKEETFEQFLASPDRQPNEQCRYLHANHGSRTWESVNETLGQFGHKLIVVPVEQANQALIYLALRFRWPRQLLSYENVTMLREKPEISPTARALSRELDGEDYKLYSELWKRSDVQA